MQDLTPLASPVASDVLIANAQTLLDQVKADLNLTQGEVTMFIPDMPDVPPQNVPVMIAQANQAQASDANTTRILGVCHPAPNLHYSLENVAEPIGEAQDYLQAYEHRTVTGQATTTILQQPKHGVLRLETEEDGNRFGEGRFVAADQLYVYLPQDGYEGKDIATVQVDFGGLKVNVKYYFQAISGVLGSYWDTTYCSKTGVRWKISSTLAPNGTNTLTSIEYQSPTLAAGNTTTDISTLASTLDTIILNSLSVDPSAVTLNLADLPNGAIGQTTDSTITLDTTASGYGWFIDPTPADNSEYLPTSNPNEWVAKAGSDAAGKMDMLSVLLHEYGHALGINHSPDPNDYMGTTLTAGVRRLPSAEEMALMQGLVAQAKAEASGSVGWASAQQVGINPDLPNNNPAPFPTIPLGGMSLAFVGLLRSSRYGGLSIAPDGSTLVTQYDWAANPEPSELKGPGSK